MVRDDGTELRTGRRFKSSYTVHLNDCLSNYFRTETSDENNLVHCDKCNKKSIAFMRFRVKQLPNILILSVKRNKYDKQTWTLTKFNNPLVFDESIQISAGFLCLDPEKFPTHKEIAKELSHIYKLYAFIVHEGKTTQQGHYYSFVKNTTNEQWYKYNDDQVSLVGDFDKIKQSSNAYILFY